MSEKEIAGKKIGSAMVVGGGIGGMQAALDLAEAGIKVYLVEKASAIGGRMVQLDKTFPTNECAMCVVSPKLVECERHLNVEILTGSEIEKVEGEAGNFDITLRRKARFVDLEKCTGCEECALVCPVEIWSEFDSEIGKCKAAFRMYPQAVPRAFAINKDERAPCVITCPARINAQGYIALISQGKYKEAFELIKHRVPFPGVLGRVCYHPCEAECNRKDIESTIAINPLKRFVSDFVYGGGESKLFPKNDEKKDKTRDRPYSFDVDVTDELLAQRRGKRIAIVGAGPCGLTAANDLACWGYTVTVFEAGDELGGMMSSGIPEYRLSRELLRLEIDNILKNGVGVKTGTSLGRDFTVQSLKKEGYRAVLLATGAHKGKGLSIPGARHKDVWQGVDFLRRINLREKIGIKGKVLVIGGGNVAVDAARSALRLGASEVHLACLECNEEMPAHSWEVELAEQEGITVHPSWSPAEILSDKKGVTGVRFVRCVRVFDDAGKFNPVCDEKEESVMEADHVVVAIGQYPDLSYLEKESGIEKTGAGAIRIDPVTYVTTEEGVFGGGDAVTGPASVIDAVAAGKETAISIDRYVRGKDMKEGREENKKSASTPEGRFERHERVDVALIPLKERLRDFREVELTLSEEKALEEAKRCLNCGICSECLECEKVCEPFAILHGMKDERLKIQTGAVIVAPGIGLFDANLKKEYGYDRYDNVLTGVQFERILSSSGPTCGEVLRPSDGKRPKRIAFIQCVGSRDPSCGNEFCSSVCCMYSIKEAMICREHDPHIKPTVFYIDIRSFGKDFERYYESAEKEYGVKFKRCMISKIYERPKSKNLAVKYIDERNKEREDEFDMVVLATGLTHAAELKPLAEKLNVGLNEYGFIKTNRNEPCLTSREGIYVAGTYAEPKDIPETVTEGSSAAAMASVLLKDARGTMIREKRYPPERDVEDEDIRIGVFVCRCGRNIGSVVDVPEVVKYASKLKGVAHADEFLYTCSKDALDTIKQRIAEHDLNRVVVASCTPRTHEEIFRDTVREAGLNRYLFEMTSLREQVSWVHREYPKEATEKAKELVGMMVAKTRRVKPLKREFSDVISTALVVGGGAAGMQAALSIAGQGYEVFLVEKEERLGGHLLELFDGLDGGDPQEFLKELLGKVNSNEKIHVITGANIKSLSGFMGNYVSVIESQGADREIKHGVVVVASGGEAYSPKTGEYGYDKSPKVITQVKLEEMLAGDPGCFNGTKTFVMIQCVGSRNDEHPYCSRVCCAHAVKNAIRLKKADPRHNIIVLYRDMRTYGFMEKYYLEAREAGVIFLRFDKDSEPDVKIDGDRITVKHKDGQLRDIMTLRPDFLVLSTGIVSGKNEALAKTLKTPLNADGFFMEAHAKIRPLDFMTEGMFFCGLAHSPRFLHESLAQAQGASVRAVTVLSKDKIEAKAITAMVSERLCKGCGVCVSVCPFEARELDEETRTANVIDVLCQGCGACAVACPSGATTHKGFTKRQIMDMTDAAIK